MNIRISILMELSDYGPLAKCTRMSMILIRQQPCHADGIGKLTGNACLNRSMNTYKRHRFPADIISYAVWLYYRFNLSHRDIEDLLGTHAAVSNLFNLGRHKVGSQHYRDLRISAFSQWSRAVV